MQRNLSSISAAASPPSPLSPADGFLRVKEGVDEMIKYVANEPSVGLYFVQQHAQASMPLLLDVKGKVTEKIHEVTLHTEDIEDSICAVRSMAEFGLPIADDMIKDINKSLKIMSKTQPKRGLIQNPTWGFQSGKSSGTWEEDLGTTDGGSSRNYFSSMFNTAKQKASTLRWPQPDFGTKDDTTEESESSAAPESSQAGGHGASTPSDTEKDDLPVSSQLLDNNTATMKESSSTDISKSVENYNKFKEEQELKLQEWLRQSEEADDNKETSNEKTPAAVAVVEAFVHSTAADRSPCSGTAVALSGRFMTTVNSSFSVRSTSLPATSRQSNSQTRLATKYSRWSSASAMPGHTLRPAPNGIILISLLPVRSSSRTSPSPATAAAISSLSLSCIAGFLTRLASIHCNAVAVVSVPALMNSEQRLTISQSVSPRPPSSGMVRFTREST
uniref:Uncharacterized protein n=2 Tax=Oryza meridionalis TaxID=40149 RepID=A0A0E0EHX5_9ORYZ